MEIRAKATVVAAAGAAAALLLRFFPPWRYPVYPACPWRALTGWRCPGCGSTHAIAALLAGRWSDAVRYNALATLLAPVALVIGAIHFYSALRDNR